jgi:hypothetical protein
LPKNKIKEMVENLRSPQDCGSLEEMDATSKGSEKKPMADHKRPLTKRNNRIGQQLDRLEEIVGLLLDATLRGRLLPSERRLIKQYREQQKQERKVVLEREEGQRCPVCRSPLPDDSTLERCPYCSLLLSEFRRGKWPRDTQARNR